VKNTRDNLTPMSTLAEITTLLTELLAFEARLSAEAPATALLLRGDLMAAAVRLYNAAHRLRQTPTIRSLQETRMHRMDIPPAEREEE